MEHLYQEKKERWVIKLSSKFDIDVARSVSIDDHEEGKVPFITNGLDNNGVVGFIAPLEKEKLFFSK